jgi:putative transposase
VSKAYQNSKIDTPDALELTVPEHVSVVMAEVAADMREGLLALAVGTGLQVMTALMEGDVTALAGPKGKHDSERRAVRHGQERGSVTLGGRRVPVQRPRVRAVDDSGELPVRAYEVFSSTAGDGEDARRPVEPPVCTGRSRAGRRAGHRHRAEHEQVGGVAQVRGADRDRAKPRSTDDLGG